MPDSPYLSRPVPTIQEVVEYYIARMASIYRSKPKAAAEMAIFLKQVLADNFGAQLNRCYDLYLAEGDQLDVIGKYVGTPREIAVYDPRNYFGFVSYEYPEGDPNEEGFIVYESIVYNETGIFLKYSMEMISFTALTDYSYLQLLGFKILENSDIVTMGSVQEIINKFFQGALTLRDNLDMSITYFYGRRFQLPPDVLKQSFPRPMGVRVEVIEMLAFDATLDGTFIFNSDTPEPTIDFGNATIDVSGTFALENVSTSTLEIVAISLSSPDGTFTIGSPSPSVPVVLDKGENISIEIEGATFDPGVHIAILTIQVYAESSGGVFYLIPILANFAGGTPFSPGFSSGFVNN